MFKDLSFKSSLSWLRVVGILEGTSLLVLFGIAMPMKYAMDMPMPVKVVGWAHGILFIGYVFVILLVTIFRRWSFLKALTAFVASLIPFGTFIIDGRLRKEEQKLA